MEKSNHPFHEWVPRPIGILVLLLMFVPPTFSGGAYLCNISEMSGGLGVWTEDIQLASFFTSIGMCLFPPFMVRFLQARRIRQTYLGCFLLLIPLNYICAVTTSVPLLLAACLLTGFVRVIAMLNCTFTIAPYLTGMDTLSMFTMKEEPSAEMQYALERKRTFLMPVLYFFILLISQLSNLLTAWFAYEYRWQDAYYVVIGMLLVAILLVVCTMPNEKKTQTYKVEWGKVPDMLLMAVALCNMAYVLVYGKTLDWFCSDSIRLSVGVLLISCGAFLFLSLRHKAEAYLPLSVFTYRNVWMSMLLFLLTMVFNSANIFVSTFAKLSTPINNLQSASLSGWAIAGCLFGLVLSILLVVKKVRFRILFCTAFLLMAASNAYLYFQYQTLGLFDNMILPTVLNYTGLLVLYSIAAAFGMKSLPSRHLATFVFLMIWMRNAIAPVVGSSLYANWLNYQQQYYVTRLMQTVDSESRLAAASFMQTKRAGQAVGKSTTEAEQLAVTSLKGRIAMQSTIVAMKDITGQTVLLLLGAAGLSFLFPYHKRETT
ncbi:MAG: MFS transporter [Bacteroidales bacterium]|nr:MFS transporter [Bacteroidales bacterium]